MAAKLDTKVQGTTGVDQLQEDGPKLQDLGHERRGTEHQKRHASSNVFFTAESKIIDGSR